MDDTKSFAARLRELSRLASPGPWLTDEPANWHGISARVCTDKYEAICPVDLKGWGRRRGLANAELLVALRNHADRLADLVEKVDAYREATDVRETFSAEGPHDDTMTLARLCTAEANAYRAMLAALDALEGYAP